MSKLSTRSNTQAKRCRQAAVMPIELLIGLRAAIVCADDGAHIGVAANH